MQERIKELEAGCFGKSLTTHRTLDGGDGEMGVAQSGNPMFGFWMHASLELVDLEPTWKALVGQLKREQKEDREAHDTWEVEQNIWAYLGLDSKIRKFSRSLSIFQLWEI